MKLAKTIIMPHSVKIKRRLHISRKLSILTTFSTLVLAFGVSGIFFAMIGLNPLDVYSYMVGVYTSPTLLLKALERAIPIGLAALGLSIAFRMNFWNIGAEGQMYMGMFASTGIVLLHAYYDLIPDYLVLLLMILASFVTGGLWCGLPAFLKAKMRVNEILTTLMMNYVAMYFVDFLIYGPWRDPKGYGFPLSIPFPEYAKLTMIFGEFAYSGLLLLCIAVALAVVILRYTKLGFELKIVGEGIDIARYAGIRITKVITLGGILSGGIAGLGGLAIVSGIIGRLRPRASPGYGYTAIIVILLSALNPWLVVPVSIFFGGIFVAGDILQATLKIPGAAVEMHQALIFLFIVVGEFLKRYKITITREVVR
ncbi:MAG: ABC transporter permease [Nitrososphaerota archaeon]